MNKDIWSIVIRLNNYISIRQVCKLFFNLYVLTPEQQDRIAIHYLLLDPKQIQNKKTILNKDGKIRLSSEPKSRPYVIIDNKLLVEDKYWCTQYNFRDKSLFVGDDYVYIQDTIAGKGKWLAYDYRKDKLIDYNIVGILIPNPKYLITVFQIEAHEHKFRPIFTVWNPGREKLKIEETTGVVANKNVCQVVGGFCFINGSIVDIFTKKCYTQTNTYNRIDYHNGVAIAQNTHNKQWYRLELYPLVNRKSVKKEGEEGR